MDELCLPELKDHFDVTSIRANAFRGLFIVTVTHGVVCVAVHGG